MQPKNQTIADPFDIYLSSPVVANGAVYFGSGDGNLYALDADSGDLRWKFATGDVVHASPAYADGVVYVGSWDSYFYAVDAATGKEKWRFHGGEDPLIHNQVGFQSSPAVVNGVVYTGCRDSNLYAIDAATGKEKWHFNNGGSWVITSPAVTQGKVIFATSDSSLYHVLDALTGKPVLAAGRQGVHVFVASRRRRRRLDRRPQRHAGSARSRKRRRCCGNSRPRRRNGMHGWVLTADRKFNTPMLYRSNWREARWCNDRSQFSVGSIFSSPLVRRRRGLLRQHGRQSVRGRVGRNRRSRRIDPSDVRGLLRLVSAFIWWLWVDSNHRPQHYECRALTS